MVVRKAQRSDKNGKKSKYAQRRKENTQYFSQIVLSRIEKHKTIKNMKRKMHVGVKKRKVLLVLIYRLPSIYVDPVYVDSNLHKESLIYKKKNHRTLEADRF